MQRFNVEIRKENDGKYPWKSILFLLNILKIRTTNLLNILHQFPHHFPVLKPSLHLRKRIHDSCSSLLAIFLVLFVQIGHFLAQNIVDRNVLRFLAAREFIECVAGAENEVVKPFGVVAGGDALGRFVENVSGVFPVLTNNGGKKERKYALPLAQLNFVFSPSALTRLEIKSKRIAKTNTFAFVNMLKSFLKPKMRARSSLEKYKYGFGKLNQPETHPTLEGVDKIH